MTYWNWMTKKSSLLSPDAPPDHCSNSTTNNPHQLCVLDKKEKVDDMEQHMHSLENSLADRIQTTVDASLAAVTHHIDKKIDNGLQVANHGVGEPSLFLFHFLNDAFSPILLSS